jgi:hypothetical protein
MEQRILIDTNIINHYLNDTLEKDLVTLVNTSLVYISVISRIELLSWSGFSDHQLKIITGFLKFHAVVSLDEQIILKSIEIRKKKKLKIPDAIIGATAIVYNLQLITLDNDFKKIKGLKINGL